MKEDMGSKGDVSEWMHLADTDTGKRLLHLVQSQKTPELEAAMQQGDYSQAVEMVREILKMPEAAHLLEKLRGNT